MRASTCADAVVKNPELSSTQVQSETKCGNAAAGIRPRRLAIGGRGETAGRVLVERPPPGTRLAAQTRLRIKVSCRVRAAGGVEPQYHAH